MFIYYTAGGLGAWIVSILIVRYVVGAIVRTDPWSFDYKTMFFVSLIPVVNIILMLVLGWVYIVNIYHDNSDEYARMYFNIPKKKYTDEEEV